MKALFGDLGAALSGIWKIVTFKEGWREDFDISASGAARSFAAALIGIPVFVLFVLGANYTAAAFNGPPEAQYTLIEAALAYARIWLVFPFAAAGAAILLGLKHHYTSWLIVHNWAVLALLTVATVPYILFAAGLSSPALLALFAQLYFLARLFVHWRIACVTLEVGPATGAAAAGIPVAIDFLLIFAL